MARPPVHPLLTDVVIGAWISAWLLDFFGGEDREDAAHHGLVFGAA